MENVKESESTRDRTLNPRNDKQTFQFTDQKDLNHICRGF